MRPNWNVRLTALLVIRSSVLLGRVSLEIAFKSTGSQKFPSRQLDGVRLLPFRVDQFQPNLWAAVCAKEDGALGNASAGGGNILYLLDYEASRQASL